MECVLCSEYWADEVEWVKDHTADKLVQCQVCTPCKYLIRDSPSHRKRWKAWHAKIQTPASTLALRERDQRRYNRALIAKRTITAMQRKDVAVRNARWKTQDRVEDALEVLEDTFPSTRPDALDTEKNIEYMLHRRKEINTVREGCPAAFAKWVVDDGTRVYDAMVNSIEEPFL